VLAPNFATAMYASSWQTRFLDKVLQSAATKTTTAESTKNVEVWSKKASTNVKFEIEEIPQNFIYLFGASK